MPEEPTRAVPGRAVVARRARLGLGSRAIRVTLHPTVSTEVWLTVAYGVPVAEVARQVDSAVRYRLERALAREVGPVSIHVQGLSSRRFASPPAVPTPAPAVTASRVEPLVPADADAAPAPDTARPSSTVGAA
jgi:Asp23 family, cell envelope-related function